MDTIEQMSRSEHDSGSDCSVDQMPCCQEDWAIANKSMVRHARLVSNLHSLGKVEVRLDCEENYQQDAQKDSLHYLY